MPSLAGVCCDDQGLVVVALGFFLPCRHQVFDAWVIDVAIFVLPHWMAHPKSVLYPALPAVDNRNSCLGVRGGYRARFEVMRGISEFSVSATFIADCDRCCR